MSATPWRSTPGEILDADRVDGPGDVLADARYRHLAEEVLRRLFGFGPQVGMGVEQRCEYAGVPASGERIEARRRCSLEATGTDVVAVGEKVGGEPFDVVGTQMTQRDAPMHDA